MRDSMRSFLGLGAVLLLVVAPAAGQDELQKLKKAMAHRLSTIESLMNQSKVGETWKGYLQGLKGVSLSEQITFDKKKITIRKFIDAENADRKASYELLAKKNSTNEKKVSADQVGQEAGTKYRKEFWKGGHSFLRKNGKWVKKRKR